MIHHGQQLMIKQLIGFIELDKKKMLLFIGKVNKLFIIQITIRLITSGTIEEKIYRKQVFKGSLIKNLFGNQKQHRF